MQRNNEYTFDGRVRFSEIDHTKKITLPAIINYFQDCSAFQSEQLGLGVEYLEERKKAWMLSAWQVEVVRYPKIAEEISIHTWASGFKGILGDRNFCMKDKDERMLAYAHSLWVYMDMTKGRPAKPEAEETARYGYGEPLEMKMLPRKIELAQQMEKRDSFAVQRSDIDTNEHVNNCRYVQMALEVLKQEIDVKGLRVEYKTSARYGDVIVPRVGKEEGRIVAELCDKAEKPYAVIEFRV